MIAGASTALARRVAPDRVTGGVERQITVDRSNDCVVVDESVFVKWLTPPAALPHRGLEVVSHLRAVGFEAMPALLGSQISAGHVEAIVFEHFPGAEDGWTWMWDAVNGWLAEVEPHRVLIDAARLGRLTADLHVAMATASEVFPDPVGSVDRATERERGRALLKTALAEVSPDHPAAHAVLHDHCPALEDAIEGIADGDTPALHIHGDLHVGQVLQVGARLVAIDFDGNPLQSGRPPAHQPPAVDVASLLQSVDHVVRMTQHRQPGHDERLDELASEVSLATLDSYRVGLQLAGRSELLDESLLSPLRAIQELHELVYAVRRLPRWAYAPALTLQAMFGHGSDR
jgi:maltokinase